MFAIPRTSGWIAQWLEMIEDERAEDRPPAPDLHGRAHARLRAARRPELAEPQPAVLTQRLAVLPRAAHLSRAAADVSRACEPRSPSRCPPSRRRWPRRRTTSGRSRLRWCPRAPPRSASAASSSRSRRSRTSPSGTPPARCATSRRRSSGCSATRRAQWYHDHDLWESRLHPEDRERVLAASARTFGEARDFACEYRLLAADDRVVWIAERETIVRDEAGRRCSATASCSTSRGSRRPRSGSSPPRPRCARSATSPTATSTSPAPSCSCSTPTARSAPSTSTATSCSATRPGRWSAREWYDDRALARAARGRRATASAPR